jgi:hypothetical protein
MDGLNIGQRRERTICIYLASSCHRAGRATAGVIRVLSFVVLGLPGGSVDTGSDIAPCTVVEGFLLYRVLLLRRWGV